MTPSSRQDPQASGTGTDFPASQAWVLVSPSLHWAYYKQETPSSFFPLFAQHKKQKKILLMSYVRGPAFNGSTTKRHVLCSRSSSSQRQIYYKVYVQWALQNLSPRDSTHENASAPSYTSHRLSPTSPRKTRSKKKSRSCKTSKSRLLLRKTPHSTFRCGMRMGPVRPYLWLWRRYWMPWRSVAISRTTTGPRRLVKKPRKRLSWQRLG